ncbi:GNAT family N-acetyltransferase [Irregularibacter muris]|nr:GNAT family N-acetyltransferase [Irregularibacter muris]
MRKDGNMLNHQGTIQLETKRLLLRRFTMDDGEDMFNHWAGDYDICKYMRWQAHRSVEETKDVINSWIFSYDESPFYLWAIEFKETQELIGSISLFVINENDLCGDVGYCVGKRYWGQGIATEALKTVLDFAFMNIGFNRIETYHSTSNPASGRVMQKCGMIFEGLARQKYKSIIGFENSNMYALLKEDYINNLCHKV